MSKSVFNKPAKVSFQNRYENGAVCPGCGGEGLSMFYSVNDVPAHSCLLMASREQALGCPRGRVGLGFCIGCGFITNVSYNADAKNYCSDYEDTQSFSSSFSAFAQSLAQRLINRYDIHGKRVLEIGCGKGEFIDLICRLGDNQGIGIDPAFVPQRRPAGSAGRVDFIRDYFDTKYANLEPDVICCRHTLEHISSAGVFLRMIRAAVAYKKKTLIFFEVPNAMRVLAKGAFWDIYHEHCSYFTPGSLARLFRNCGFEIDDLYTDYDNQYLIITAYPADSSTTVRLFDCEDNIEQLSRAVLSFEQRCAERIDYWQKRLTRSAGSREKVVVWGSSSNGVSFLTTLEAAGMIEYVVDVNPYKHGRYIPSGGQQIVSPQFLADYEPQRIIAMNPIYLDEIQRDLERLAVKAQLVPVTSQ